MRHSVILFMMSLGYWACTPDNEQYPALEFNGMYQLDSLHGQKFDLSGIAKIGDSLYVIADKPWNKFLYSIAFGDSTFKFQSRKHLNFKEKLDLEGIDHCGGITYLVNERQGLIYRYTSDDSLKIITVNFDSLGINPTNWGNTGWEGIASDCHNGLLYVLKEREPRCIYTIDTQTWSLKDTFNIAETESHDFSDAKFENGHLYVIERFGDYVTKIDPVSKEVIAKYHYKNIASNSAGKLYGPTSFGMGEALLLTEDEIWIGLDNNGLKTTEYATENFGISGKAPVIIKFKRPEGF